MSGKIQRVIAKRDTRIYNDNNIVEEVNNDKIMALYDQLQLQEIGSSGYESMVKTVSELSKIALQQQAVAHETKEAVESDRDSVVKYGILTNKIVVIIKQLCLLSLTPNFSNTGFMSLTLDLGVILKVYSDCLDSYRSIDKTAFLAIVDFLLKIADEQKFESSKKALTVTSYIIYNLFRYSDQLKIGEDDLVCKLCVKYKIVQRIVGLCNKGKMFDLGQDAITTYVEALGALADTEAFLDYIGQLIPHDFGRAFVQYYDDFVIPLLEVPEERGKMLCYDDVLSWIRRERPQYEQ